MPELPEVETIRNELIPYVVGHLITDVTFAWEGVLRRPSVEEFRSRFIGEKIIGVSRRGKYLVFSLTSNEVLIVHLKMSGSLLIESTKVETDRFTRAIIHLDTGKGIYFRDPRKFGAMWLVGDANSIVGKLGPEPLETDFTPELLAQRLVNRKASIKALLCDQNIIAGIGNMYADETLFAAKIHPLRSGGSLSPNEAQRLHKAILGVLRSAIDNKGASIENYIRPNGTLGTAHFQFQVAHRRGKTCPICCGPIERIVVRNRGTYFCPKCQPAGG